MNWKIPGVIERLEPAVCFRFSSGVGIVMATDDDERILHLRIIGTGSPIIGHLPILRTRVEPHVECFVVGRLRSDMWDVSVARNAVAAWRVEHNRDEAGAFLVPLGQAIRRIYEVAPDLTDQEHIATAYPIRDSQGRFEAVRLVAKPASQLFVAADARP